MKRILSRNWIILVLVAFCGLTACDSGAKKLEKKPKTHVRKKVKEEKGLITVFETPAPKELYSSLSAQLGKLKEIAVVSEDTLSDPAFVLGALFSELSFVAEKKDQRKIHSTLQKIQGSFTSLGITDQSLDSLLGLPLKVSLKNNSLSQKADELFPKVKELMRVSGRDIDLGVIKVGVLVHQLDFVLSNRSEISKLKLNDLLDLQKSTAQNLLSSLVELENNGRLDVYKLQLESVLSSFDTMQSTSQPELIYKNDDGVYIISGGKELEFEEESLSELHGIIKSFNQKASTDETK